jgi:hypothetical protein
MSSSALVATLRSKRLFASPLLLATVLLASSTLLVGCQPPPKPAPPPPPPPVTMADVDRAQATARQRDPHARAGLVMKVKAEDQNAAVSLAAVGSDDADRIREGDVFTFTDSRNNPIAVGSVVYIDGSVYVIHYAPLDGGHAPAPGDIALHLTTR